MCATCLVWCVPALFLQVSNFIISFMLPRTAHGKGRVAHVEGLNVGTCQRNLVDGQGSPHSKSWRLTGGPAADVGKAARPSLRRGQ